MLSGVLIGKPMNGSSGRLVVYKSMIFILPNLSDEQSSKQIHSCVEQNVWSSWNCYHVSKIATSLVFPVLLNQTITWHSKHNERMKIIWMETICSQARSSTKKKIGFARHLLTILRKNCYPFLRFERLRNWAKIVKTKQYWSLYH